MENRKMLMQKELSPSCSTDYVLSTSSYSGFQVYRLKCKKCAKSNKACDNFPVSLSNDTHWICCFLWHTLSFSDLGPLFGKGMFHEDYILFIS